MKRELPLRSNALALALALSVAIGVPQAGHADVKGLMNPMNWFSGDSSEKAAQKAAKKALEAQEAADRAMAEAQKAQEQAAEARRQAEALQNSQPSSTEEKPVVVAPPSQSQTEAMTQRSDNASAADSADSKAEQVYQEANTQSASPANTRTEESAFTATPNKQEPWNPLSWFKKSPDQMMEPEASNQQEASKEVFNLKHSGAQQEESQEADSAKASSETESKGSFWNPMRLIAKPQTQANSEPASEAALQQTAPSAEVALKTKAAVLETEKGNIAFELYPDMAPQTVTNFAKLVSEGFYNRYNMKFHRVVPGFVIQTGDPTGTGAGGSKEHIPLEAKNKLSHNTKGVVAMARGADPNSATSQFYITLAPQTSLDGKYAIFGKVISGLDVLDKIEKDDMLYGIKLVDINTITRDAAPEKKNFFSSMF